MDITPGGLFKRMISDKKGYGSYCFGLNELLLGALRGLDYRAYAAQARINRVPPKSSDVNLAAPEHMVVIVQVQSSPVLETFLVDVGYGVPGPVRPLLLLEGFIVKGAASPEEHRLTRGRHPHSSLESAESADFDPALHWRVEVRCGNSEPGWRVLYQFSLEETYPEDRDAMNFATSQRRGSGFFWDNVVCVSYFAIDKNGEENDDLGRMVMFGTGVQRKVGDRSETVVEMNSDIERLRALRLHFGVDISDDATDFIVGRESALG